jgi:thiol-disulfide isomerase/thioredoxin
MLAEKGLNTREADRASVDDAVKKFQASFIDKLKANFAERLSQASNPAVQKAYLVTLVNLPGELAPEFAKHVLVTISPLDPAWGFGSRGIKRAIESTDEPETYEDYLQLAATKNPIEDVRGELLFDPMLKAYFAKDKVAWEKHYDMLMTHAPNSARAVYARRRFNPNPIEVGEEIPSFSIASLGDEEIVYSKESMKGTYYLIDFWATWCVPCIAELPRLHRMYEMYKDTNFTILSLSFDQIAQDIAPFREKRWPMPWHHAFVEDGFKNQLARDFHVSGIPKPILVDPKGRIVAIGEQLEGENLEKILAEILGNKPKNQ